MFCIHGGGEDGLRAIVRAPNNHHSHVPSAYITAGPVSQWRSPFLYLRTVP